MRMGIISFMVRGKEVRFKEPLMLDNEMIDGQLCLSHQELNLFVYGYSWGECNDQIHEELAMLWEEYALAPDEELTEDAIALKEKLLRMVEE